MKIAIITAFRNMPESYSLVNDVRDQIKLLMNAGHEVVFYAQQTCQGEGIDCEMRAILPHFRIEKEVVNHDVKKQIIEIFKKELSEFDVAITHDLMYLRGFVTYRAAIMECGVDIKWLHWVHSGIGEMLKLKMPNSKYIYMNHADKERFARHIGVDKEDVGVVYNDKDPELFFNWHNITRNIANKVDLFRPDILQVYPFCTTRMNAKGIDRLIKVFSHLKKLGNKVLLVCINSNARKRKDEVKDKMQLAKDVGLDENDIVFTSQLDKTYQMGLPRQVVRDLMQMANLFVFPSTAEVCSNVLLEASMTKQLIVINADLPCLYDFTKDAIEYNFGSIYHVAFASRNDESYSELAKKITEELKNNKINQQFLKIKKECNLDYIYTNQLKPLLNS